MLPKCSYDDHQLLYNPERLNDIIELKHRVECNGIYINDIMHAFKGDNLVSQLESRRQKYGDYFCWLCTLFAENFLNIVHTMSLRNLSLANRVSKICLANASNKNLKKTN